MTTTRCRRLEPAGESESSDESLVLAVGTADPPSDFAPAVVTRRHHGVVVVLRTTDTHRRALATLRTVGVLRLLAVLQRRAECERTDSLAVSAVAVVALSTLAVASAVPPTL